MNEKYEARKSCYKTALSVPECLYKHESVNLKGKIPKNEENAGTYYTECIAADVVADGILDRIREFDRAAQADYCPHAFSKIRFSPVTQSRMFRREENIAFGLCKNGKMADGNPVEFLDYQYPVVLLHSCDKIENETFGKVDLIFQTQGITYLGELKNDKSEETLLRCIMEVSTYYRQINKKRFCSCFSCQPEQIGKAVMIFRETRPYREYLEMQNGNRPNLKALLDQEQIAVFLVTSDTLTLNCSPDAATDYRLERLY